MREESSPEDWKRRVEWHKKMHAGGWVGISWPKEYGGRGATLMQQIIYNEELAKVDSPALVNGLGIMLVGPTIIHWGTEEQKKRHIPKILSADELWCQGYSEPNAGSDCRLAADPRPRGRRLLYRQRPEGLDLRRPSRRYVYPAGPHRSQRAQA